ncbi:MAG: PHP domain-containing protein [Actinomycetota bacterium]|nr:PHP domain-containing protein [Actinomycetota bacterium]
MAGYDLHTHTTFSDGTTTPAANVELALRAGLEGLAVTDHDTADAWQPARDAAAGTALEIVPGVELSAELSGASIHVLGYWFDPTRPALAAEMRRLRNERVRRGEQIVARFNELGIPISIERVREIAGDAPLGRPHIASAVVELGAAADVDEVFGRWLHDGGPAYVPKYAVDPVTCVQLVVDAGGVAVLAHPGLYGPDDSGLDAGIVEAMASAGLAGIEADHPDHSSERRALYRDLAVGLDLVITGGSDFHGDRKDLALGEVATPRAQVERLRARLRSPRPQAPGGPAGLDRERFSM